MADYKELLRRAIEALPENNGAARRAVYEKARSALVAQLRAIDPPLPARDITQHRLQLEDCIRQVEQEASEANISGLKSYDSAAEAPAPARPVVMPPPGVDFSAVPAPQVAGPTEPVNLQPAPVLQATPTFQPNPPPPPAFEPEPEPEIIVPADEFVPEAAAERESSAVSEPEPAPQEPESGSIEDIIAAAERTTAESVPDVEPEPEPVANTLEQDQEGLAAESIGSSDDLDKSGKEAEEPASAREPLPFPTLMPRVDGNRPPSAANSVNPVPVMPFEPARRGPTFEIRRDNAMAQQVSETALTPRVEPAMRGQAAALQQVAEPIAVLDQPANGMLVNAPAMSSVREVDVEAEQGNAHEAQVTIERAIATLDREARGETSPIAVEAAGGDTLSSPPPLDGLKRAPRLPKAVPDAKASAEHSFGQAGDEERSGFNAITLFLVVFLLLLVGAGGAGYWAWREGYVDLDAMFGQSAPAIAEAQTETAAENPPAAALPADENATAPGNTATPAPTQPTAELQPDSRLTGDPAAPATADPTVPGVDEKIEERLPSVEETAPEAQIAPSQAPVLDATATAGSQSLLLEAADNGTTGAVPFSGTIDWSRGEDETGEPTIVGKASIPARNLDVDLLIRRNVDPSLPASHLMEINFEVTDSFIGGSIAGLPGVLLKNEELVQGTPLVGASARVVGNSFLFALSASEADEATNTNLLTTRKWMDLAIVYATGKRAIITLEKDPAAEALFRDVFAAWGQTESTAQ